VRCCAPSSAEATRPWPMPKNSGPPRSPSRTSRTRSAAS
jgi:hypothetical protein